MAKTRFLILLISFSVFGAETLHESFSVDKNPGSGTLRYKKGGQEEIIQFGSADGHYALGMFFSGNKLPAPFNKEFKDQMILQIAMGNLKEKFPKLTPQFGSLTLSVKGKLGKARSFKLSTPMGNEMSLSGLGLLLFSTPQFVSEQTDEEKLRATYFGKGGDVVVSSGSDPVKIEMPVRGKSLTFRRQIVSLQISGTLANPFNPEEARLLGKIDLPVYWPVSPASEKLMIEIATEGLAASTPPQRDLTNKPAK